MFWATFSKENVLCGLENNEPNTSIEGSAELV